MQSTSSTSSKSHIRILLGIVVIVLAIMSLVFSLLINSRVRTYDKDSNHSQVASQILSAVYERRIIADDYLRYPSDRARSQWQTKQNEIDKLISDNEQSFHSDPGEKDTFDKVKESLKDSSVTFQNVLKTFNKSSNDPTYLDQKSRLASELEVKGLVTITAASKLRDLNHDSAQQAHYRITILFSAVASIFLGILLISFVVIWRSANELYRKQSENAAMLGSIGDGVFAINKHREIILFNRSAELITGYNWHDAIGKNYDSILKFKNEKTGKLAEGFIEKALHGAPSSMDKDTVLVKQNGDVIPVADSAAPIKESGHNIGAVVVFRDITKERELERAKDDFLSLASHQLRTPATAVKQYLGLVIQGYASSKKDADSYIQDAYKSNDEQLQIIDDILNVAKLDAGKLDVKKESCELGEIVSHAAKELEGQVKSKGHDLTIDKPDNKMPISADNLKLTMSIQNLISNAIKYTPDNGKIKVSVNDQDNKYLITVEDNGIGIKPEDMGKLFNKFSRLQTDFTAKVQGTGLGLYIVKQIIELHGGSISARPAKPSGTAFTIELPKQ